MAKLFWETNGVRHAMQLDGETLQIGRAPSCDICLAEDREISRFHCTIEKRASDRFAIQDNGSTNGTRINQRKIGEDFVTLHHNDTIRAGKTELLFIDENADVTREALDEIADQMEHGKGFSTIFHEIVESGRK